MDWLGVLAPIVVFQSLQLGWGERLGWFSSSEIIINTILSATAFLHICSTLPNRKHRILWVMLMTVIMIGSSNIYLVCAASSSLFVLPLFLQNIQGYPVHLMGFIRGSNYVCNDALRFFIEYIG